MPLIKIAFLPALLFLLTGCHQKPDYSALVAQIDQYIDKIHEAVERDRSVVAVSRKPMGGKLSIEYFDMDGQPAKVLAVHRTDDFVKSIHYHLKDGELVNVRFRYLRMNPDPYAEETFSYLKDGKIFFAKDRTIHLEPGQNAAPLKELPLEESKRPKEELFKAFDEYWDVVKKAVEEDRKARALGN